MRAITLPSSIRVSHRPTLQIQELVALSYGLHPKHMISHDRTRRIAHVRQIAMFLTRKLTHRSMSAIGGAFGGRDHSTVCHAISAVEERMRRDPFLVADIETLREVLVQ